MALTRDIVPYWFQGIGPSRFNRNTTLLASTTIFKGGVAMQVGGKIQNPVTGAAMVALCTAIAGADANGGLSVSARQLNVRLQLIGGTSKVLGVTVVYGATIDVIVQQSTDGGAVVTSTSKAVSDAILAHGIAGRLLRVKPTGDGTGLTATTAATAIKHITLLGVPEQRLVNTTLADVTLQAEQGIFGVGNYRMTSADAPAMADTLVAVASENTVKKTIDALDILVPLRVIEGTALYCDLAAAY